MAIKPVPEYSTNLMDLNLEIGYYSQLLAAGEHNDDQEAENLEAIQKAIHKITYRMLGGNQ